MFYVEKFGRFSKNHVPLFQILNKYALIVNAESNIPRRRITV